MLLILCVNWVTSRRGMEINEKNDLKQSVRLKKRPIDYHKAFKRNI